MLTIAIAILLCVLSWTAMGPAALLWLFPGCPLIDLVLGAIGLPALMAGQAMLNAKKEKKEQEERKEARVRELEERVEELERRRKS